MISILMPVKNAGSYLSECLDSIIAQSFLDWELIAVDDGSSDDSFKTLTEYAETDSRIRVCQNEGEGIISALTQAYNISKGDWISRMDADDLMPEHKLQKFYEGRAENRVVTGKVKYFSETEVSEGYKRYEDWINLTSIDSFKHIYRECIIASPNWLVSRVFFENKFDWKLWSYPEDYDLVFHWRKAELEIYKIDEVTHLWREHPKRTSRNSDVYQQESFFRLKTRWFVKDELSTGEKVQLIGSGNKAKLVSNILTELGVEHTQFSIKKDVGRSVEDLDPRVKAILTAWPLDQQKRREIALYVGNKGFELGENLWIF